MEGDIPSTHKLTRKFIYPYQIIAAGKGKRPHPPGQGGSIKRLNARVLLAIDHWEGRGLWIKQERNVVIGLIGNEPNDGLLFLCWRIAYGTRAMDTLLVQWI